VKSINSFFTTRKRAYMKRYHHLTLAQRYLIQTLLKTGKTGAFIATELGCHRSTISRELRRNGRQDPRYSPMRAQEMAVLRRPAPDYSREKITGVLKQIILEKLTVGRWSPEQISQRLKLEREESISHEAIYQFIYADRISGGTLYKSLRHHGRRRKRALIRRNRLWPKNEPRKFIEDRPIKATDRKECGHWERDLIIGKIEEKANLLTLVDRKSRYTIIEKVEGKFSEVIATATQKVFEIDPNLPLKTITNDNGTEFCGFSKLEKALDAPIYFTHPYCSWERGTNENTNGLIREFFPKGSSMSNVSNEDVKKAEEMLNNRPRKILNFRTPKEILHSLNNQLFRSTHYYRKKVNEEEFQESA
jgi:IS30 family transposase